MGLANCKPMPQSKSIMLNFFIFDRVARVAVQHEWADELVRCEATARHVAEQAREITRRWFRTTMPLARKVDHSPVTVADHETERIMRAIIVDRHPEHGVFGEETGQYQPNVPWQWVIDPIDGTKCFATGMPTFGTLIALLHHQQPLLGLIDHPILAEQWLGIAGQPTTYNGQLCHSRATTTLAEAAVYSTSADMFTATTRVQADTLARACRFRVFGGDCYGYGLLASGFNDLMCEADMQPYDFLALIPVIEGAGGVISDWQGQPLTIHSSGEVLAAANAELHAKALACLQSVG